ncbi:MAG: DegT/DnrJ/EryC1/StrS aminotransferase family protein [Candidatus Omnitrophica bacterium]|nr:DegT/DnrJ/EryC1/StrS aminotransferase family protein [Candidatus Omnitrophota bacterium]
MSKLTVPLSPIVLGEEEIAAAQEVLRSGQLREGKITRQFEEEFARWAGVRHAITASSGTAALHLAYLALIRPGDEVLVSAFTFIATASMVVMAGGKPVFCDIDPKTWTLAPSEIPKRMTPKTKAIAGVHLFGNSCDIQAISEMAGQYNLKIIWDGAQALAATYQSKNLAQYPDAVCFSFYPTKNITTGEGGMVATQEDAVAAKIRLLKNHGYTGRYEHAVLGFNYRMTELEAAIGVIQLGKSKNFIEKRKRLAAIYKQYVEDSDVFQVQHLTSGAEHSYNYFSVALRPDAISITREEFCAALEEEGVQNAVHYPRGLHMQRAFSALETESLPVTESLCRRIFSLPMSPFLNEEDIDFCARTLVRLGKKFFIHS